MKIFNDIEQGTPEWFDLRLGSIGGSGIEKATSKGRGKQESKTRTSYLYKKADEIMTGIYIDSYKNEDMQLGTDSEPYSRDTYAWEMDVDVEQVALIKHSDHKHCSPDGLVGNNGMIQIKNTNGPNFIEWIVKDKMPPKHEKQIQWELMCSEREWCDFVHSCWIRNSTGEIVARYPDIKIWTKRQYRDEKLIKELNDQADEFISEMYSIIEKIKRLSK